MVYDTKCIYLITPNVFYVQPITTDILKPDKYVLYHFNLGLYLYFDIKMQAACYTSNYVCLL